MICKICGEEIPDGASYYNENGPICSYKCLLIENFWESALDDEAIIIDGRCYHDGGHCNKYDFHGFDGTTYYIKMFNGKIIKTNNLWANGPIPENRNVKDNAKFIKKEEYLNEL